MWHDMDMNGWWFLWGAIMMLIFWGGLAAFIIWGVRSFRDDHHSAVDIARERFARGEINQEEFDRIRHSLAS
jgi:putative membrane protein